MTSSFHPASIAFSIVIPAHNEQHRIFPYLDNIIAYFSRRHTSYEIIVVDDGSYDGTADGIAAYGQRSPSVKLIRLPKNTGKGAAVRAGMAAARGRLRLMADADGATAIQELDALESAITGGADIAIGSRAMGSRDARYRVRARWHRTVLGNLFNGIVRRLGIEGISDTQCGFKLFRQRVADDVFSIARIDGYGFDLEVLFIALRRRYRIAEIPINWTDRPGSKVRVVRDGLAMFRELALIRRHYARGLYEESRNEAGGKFCEVPDCPPA
jgi:dolichyl-phosphate beta-glucosyltransferase